MNGLIQDLLEINRRLSFELWHLTAIKEKPSGLSPRMLLPAQADEDIRIGEHEPMVLSETSASSDLNLFNFQGDAFHKVAGVEFKAHNPGEEIIRQDINKLLEEKVTGNWFHILEDIDSETLTSLFTKFTSSLRSCTENLNDDPISILFCFCVLEKRWTCIKHFYYDESRGEFDLYVNSFFDLDFTVESDHIVVTKGLDWYIFQLYSEGFLGH
jgi:hypothetical protein